VYPIYRLIWCILRSICGSPLGGCLPINSSLITAMNLVNKQPVHVATPKTTTVTTVINLPLLIIDAHHIYIYTHPSIFRHMYVIFTSLCMYVYIYIPIPTSFLPQASLPVLVAKSLCCHLGARHCYKYLGGNLCLKIMVYILTILICLKIPWKCWYTSIYVYHIFPLQYISRYSMYIYIYLIYARE